MGIVASAISLTGAFLGAVLVALFKDEIKAWLPTLNERIIASAAGRLPHSVRDRYREEWQAFVEEVPGSICQLIASLGFFISSVRVCPPKLTLEPVRKLVFTKAVLFLLLGYNAHGIYNIFSALQRGAYREMAVTLFLLAVGILSIAMWSSGRNRMLLRMSQRKLVLETPAESAVKKRSES